MSQPLPRPMSLDEFFAWQERQDDRFELVSGQPLRMMAGVTNRHDPIVVNLIIALGTRLRGSGCTTFTGDSAIETYPGQIRRPDVGVDCARRDPNAYRAAEPRFVAEVLSPSTRDFDTYAKVVEYKSVSGLDYVLLIEPNAPEAVMWVRAGAEWRVERSDGLEASIDLPGLGVSLPMAELYDSVTFPTGPRLAFGRLPEE